MTDDPKASVPDDEAAKELAAEAAADAVRMLRASWGDSAQAAMPLLRDYPPKTLFQRQQAEFRWPDDVRPIYLDAFRDELAALNVVYVVTHEGGIPYIVDYARWGHPTLRPGTIYRVVAPNAGWTRRSD